MKAKMSLLAAVVLLAALLVPMSASAYTMYVKTANGGAVNLRDEPTTDSWSITKIGYGSAVDVLQNEGEWSAINWPGRSNPAWMASKYLVNYYPGTSPSRRDSGDSSEGTSSVADLNFKSFKLVEPYYAYVRANYSGGYVNLRWAPSMDAAVAQRVNDGSEIKVIAEGRGWYQIQDERSGYVGFMKSGFIVRYDDDGEH